MQHISDKSIRNSKKNGNFKKPVILPEKIIYELRAKLGSINASMDNLAGKMLQPISNKWICNSKKNGYFKKSGVSS